MKDIDRRVLCSLIFPVLALLVLPAGAAAHEELREAAPADGDTVAIAPDELRLTFINTVQLGLAHLTLVGPEGAVELAELRRASDAAHVLVGPIRGPLVAGTYTVRWQVAGPDGHPVRGEYTFTILKDAEGVAPAPIGPEAVSSQESGVPAADAEAVPGSDFDSASPLYAGVRWITFLGLLGVIGAVAFRVFVLSILERSKSLSAEAVVLRPASTRAVRIGLGAVAVLAVALILRLYAQLYALHGPTATFDTGRIGTLLGGTTWGLGWCLQAGGIVAAAIGFVIARRRVRFGWGLAAVAAVVLAFTPALSGHAVGVKEFTWLAVLAHGLHVLGAGGWLGGLLVVVIAGLPVALRQPTGGGSVAAALINAYSPTALFFAGIVVATGVFSAWLHVGAMSSLWTTSYGRTLLLKLAVLSIVFGTGAYNWLKVRPALGSPAAAGRLRRSATVELIVAMVVLAITAVLVATPLPAHTLIP